MTMQMKLPIGIEDFADIRTLGFYYVDKTNLISELLRSWGRVNFFTRPRRFGKTLNMSMLKYFFEIGTDKTLFEGLHIAEERELCEEYLGNFPVISISLKGAAGENYEIARAMLGEEIRREAKRFQFLLENDRLTPYDRQDYIALINREHPDAVMSEHVMMSSLLTLSSLLYKHYGKKVIMLIDEYDVPLDKAFEKGYYDRMVELIRNLFQQALKTNDYLYLAVLTGCLRISKESIFTGLNIFKVFTVTDVWHDENFGFTDIEVHGMLEYYDRTECYATMKQWYDGYRFGEVDVYCPWDVICYCCALRADRNAEPKAYWINTSSNSIVKRFIHNAKGAAKRELEQLVGGGVIAKNIRQELTYNELDSTIDNLWSILFTTGYLTQRGKTEDGKYLLAIPNLEVQKIFEIQIMEWFEESARQEPERLKDFCRAFLEGNAASVEEQFNAWLKQTISIRDTAAHRDKKENFYHGILLGLLSYEEDWILSSNAESGDGYSDILIEVEEEQAGIVIEVKYAKDGALDAACREAIKQITEKGYAQRLRQNDMERILAFGVACYKKRCRVIVEEQ